MGLKYDLISFVKFGPKGEINYLLSGMLLESWS